ncbi:hypothetical protein N9A86_00400 [Akkermansiaceae bacterium]|nr:hypothetical protein [Akkermansiaceae bacterium]
MKRLIKLAFLAFLIGGAYAGWKYQDQLVGFYNEHFKKDESSYAELVPDPERYEELKSELSEKRRELSIRYEKARTAQEISAVHREARETLENALPAMMRCWLGTPWDFNGTARTPGSGKIACGYYVSTIMQDVGFEVKRIELAQQASQNIIKTFIPQSDMHIRTQTTYDNFLEQVCSRGPGIRIVGLDRHVAFLVVPEDGDIRFIHSSGAAPKRVVDEDRENADVLRRSQYRVTGNITGNDQVIHRWLTGGFWPTSK